MMKRKGFFWLMTMLLVAAFSFEVCAAGKLKAENVKADEGETFCVEVKIQSNPGIVATRICAQYDSEYLTLERVENGEIFDDSKAVLGKDFSQNPYYMLWNDPLGNDIADDGCLARLYFRVEKDCGGDGTDINFTVDKDSTFDQNLTEKELGSCECTVRSGSGKGLYSLLCLIPIAAALIKKRKGAKNAE